MVVHVCGVAGFEQRLSNLAGVLMHCKTGSPGWLWGGSGGAQSEVIAAILVPSAPPECSTRCIKGVRAADLAGVRPAGEAADHRTLECGSGAYIVYVAIIDWRS